MRIEKTCFLILVLCTGAVLLAVARTSSPTYSDCVSQVAPTTLSPTEKTEFTQKLADALFDSYTTAINLSCHCDLLMPKNRTAHITYQWTPASFVSKLYDNKNHLLRSLSLENGLCDEYNATSESRKTYTPERLIGPLDFRMNEGMSLYGCAIAANMLSTWVGADSYQAARLRDMIKTSTYLGRTTVDELLVEVFTWERPIRGRSGLTTDRMLFYVGDFKGKKYLVRSEWWRGNVFQLQETYSKYK